MLGSGSRPNVVQEAQRLRPLVEQYAEIVAFDLSGQLDLAECEADVAIVLGGDGAILRAAHQMGPNQIPVLAVNLGKLGFLAGLSPAELPTSLKAIADGNLRVIEHLMFDCRLLRGKQEKFHKLGLNEILVIGGPPYSIVNIDLYVDSELVTTYSCDGLIVATPVGSTAHSLSAGGPILRKNMQAFVISPISPHTLTNRPVVDSADHVYELVVPNPHAATSVVVDGHVLSTLQPGDRVRVERATPTFKLVTATGHSDYRTLREKLGWGGQLHLK